MYKAESRYPLGDGGFSLKPLKVKFKLHFMFLHFLDINPGYDNTRREKSGPVRPQKVIPLF